MKKTLIFSIVLASLTAILKYTALIPAIHNQWYAILVFYFILTTFILHRLLLSLQKTPRKFIASFLSMTALRMVLFTTIILLYAFLIQHDNSRNVVGFILTFAVYYLLFTTWEIVLIVAALKN
jgi:hypothetical protein